MGDRLLSVNAWRLDVAPAFKRYQDNCDAIGDIVKDQCKMVTQCFHIVGSLIEKAVTMVKPETTEALIKFMDPLPKHVCDIQNHRDNYRAHDHFIHLSTVSEGVAALTWIGWPSQDNAKGVKEYREASAYYANKVIVKYKKLDSSHVEWANSWLDFLTHLSDYLKVHHRYGMDWNTQNASSGKPPLPPAPPPALPPVTSSNTSNLAKNVEMLLKDINVGEDITKGLKHITKKKGPPPTSSSGTSEDSCKSFIPDSSKQSNIPDSCKSVQGKSSGKSVQGKPKHALEGRKWAVEYQTDTRLSVDPAYSHTMYAYKCERIFIEMTNKILGITLDSCENLDIQLNDIVSSLEIINCKNIKAQSFGTMPTLSISKSDNVLVYLAPECMDVQIITEKSSEVNIAVPTKDSKDFTEQAVPEQFMTVVANGVLQSIPILKK